jgi:hypothetical protein
MSDVYMQPFVHDALEELEKSNFFDNYAHYTNIDDTNMVRLTRQKTNDRRTRSGLIELSKLESLETKLDVKNELIYLMDGDMPDLERHPIGRKLNKLWKLIKETSVTDSERKNRQKEFVDNMRHHIRHQLYPRKYTTQEYTDSIRNCPPTKNNLKDCNEIYKEYNRKRETQQRFM